MDMKVFCVMNILLWLLPTCFVVNVQPGCGLLAWCGGVFDAHPEEDEATNSRRAVWAGVAVIVGKQCSSVRLHGTTHYDVDFFTASLRRCLWVYVASGVADEVAK